MKFISRYVRFIDLLNEYIGRLASWLVLGCVLTCFLVVLLRYAWNTGFVWMQELYVWQHALVFMLGAGYTLLHERHVRVDVFYSKLSPRGQSWVNLLGTLVFLWPWLIIVSYYGWPYITSSWQLLENSPESGGLPGYFLLKTVIYVFCGLLLLQSLATICRSLLLIVMGRELPLIRSIKSGQENE